MTDKTKGTEILALFLIMVVALALTPTLQTASVDAQYTPFTNVNTVVVSTSNSTTLTYSARNGSTNAINDLYWTISLNQTNYFGFTTIKFGNTQAGNVTYSADKTVTFGVPCLNSTKTYLVTITYSVLSVSTAIQGLVLLLPLLWIILIIACVIVIAYKKLKLG